MSTYRSPLARARGFGSAKTGVLHFWTQRVSALALIPLTLWLVYSLARLPAGYEAARWWVQAPSVALALGFFVATSAYHSMLGVQTIIEDYVGSDAKKIATMIFSNLMHVLIGVVGVFSILRIAFAR